MDTFILLGLIIEDIPAVCYLTNVVILSIFQLFLDFAYAGNKALEIATVGRQAKGWPYPQCSAHHQCTLEIDRASAFPGLFWVMGCVEEDRAVKIRGFNEADDP